MADVIIQTSDLWTMKPAIENRAKVDLLNVEEEGKRWDPWNHDDCDVVRDGFLKKTRFAQFVDFSRT